MKIIVHLISQNLTEFLFLIFLKISEEAPLPYKLTRVKSFSITI